jgi:anti-sigma factor RsiW
MKKDGSTPPNAPDAHRGHIADHGLDGAVSEQDLNAYMDGELPTAKRRTLELRLATDSAVRSRLTKLVQVRTLVRLAYGATVAE